MRLPIYPCSREFCSHPSGKVLSRSLLVLCLMGVSLSSPAADNPSNDGEPMILRVMTFNIRFGTAEDGENSWPKRRELVFDVIRNYQPTVLGVQEALRFQLDELSREFPHFAEIGVGRDDGRQAGEYAAILFDARELELLEQGTFWFSDTPDQPGSLTWSSEFARICTWAHLQDKTSGKEFYMYNVHWDHQSVPSRQNSADLLLDRIAERADTSVPVVVMGDFNAGEKTPEIRKLLSDPQCKLVDSFRALHPEATNVRTFHGFHGEETGAKIDSVLVSPQWHVRAAEIVRANANGRYPSDHYPVTATLEW